MPLTILDHVASESVALQAGRIKTLLAGTEIHAAVRENFEDHPDGGHRCKLCGERVGHPRAAAAHLAVKHWHALKKPAKGDTISAYGTGEGATKGWDTRGRGRNEHADVMKKHGFAYRGKSGGLHRYASVTPNPKHEGSGFGKNLDHNVWVDQQTGRWAHEAGFNRTNMAYTRGRGNDAQDLDKYFSSGRHTEPGRMARSGSVWDKLR